MEDRKIRKIYRVNNGVSEEIKWEDAKVGFIIRITNQDGTPIKTTSGAECYRIIKGLDTDGVLSVEDLDKNQNEVKPQDPPQLEQHMEPICQTPTDTPKLPS